MVLSIKNSGLLVYWADSADDADELLRNAASFNSSCSGEVTETSDLVCILYSVDIKKVIYYTISVLYEVAAEWRMLVNGSNELM